MTISMSRKKRIALSLLVGAAAALAAEAFLPPGRQPSARLCLAAIDAYQATGSHLLQACGARCRYTPSCSRYAEDAIAHYGTVEGAARTAGRLWRCSPWGGCGHDPAVEIRAGRIGQETIDERKAREEEERRAREEAQRVGREIGRSCAEGGAVCIVLLLIGLVGLAIEIVILVWIYKDAKARGDQNAVVWLLLTFFTGLIGLIIYLVVRPKGDLAPCAGCHHKKLMTLARCPHCGQESGAGGAVG